MSVRDLLIEIGTEELPPKSLPELSRAFTDGVVAGLDAAGIRHGAVQPYATPRRLAVLVKRVAERQADQAVNRKGPPVSAAFDASGAPTRAATAFADSCGTTVAALSRVTEPKGEFLSFTGVKVGGEVLPLLAGIAQQSLDKLPIAKRMRWGAGEVEFVRPVHWVVGLFGKDLIPGQILGLTPGTLTRGHRFHATKPLRISSPATYARKLLDGGHVIAEFAVRRDKIREGVTRLAQELGGEALIFEPLLDEVTALVEWPVPVAGRFEERFLALPEEVIVATIQDHQRYFPVRAADGRLTPWFITVSNIESRDPAQVRAGNERVVRPRLSDAAFFWETDRRTTLAARREALKSVTFQAALGSYFDKTERVAHLSGAIAHALDVNEALCVRAAELCKCDLLTSMVGEFPELQGLIGSRYATLDGEASDVAAAMAEHYQPRVAGGALPATGTGTVVALADKLDTLVGIFAIGQKPSGTRDPFGLRRAALGILRILLEGKRELDLTSLIDVALKAVRKDAEALAAQRGKPLPLQLGADGRDVIATEVQDYIFERLRAYYLESERGYTTEMFDAVLANRPGSPLDFNARLRALRAFLDLPDAQSLAAANKRIANILRKAEGATRTSIDPALFREEAEQRLHRDLEALRESVELELQVRNYSAALSRLATLRPAVDRFFDGVMVMDADLAVRANRLALLGELRALFLRVADLSRLPG